DVPPSAGDDASGSAMSSAADHAPGGGSGGAGNAVGSGAVNVSIGGVVASSGPVPRVGDGPVDRTTGAGPVDRAGVSGDAASASGTMPGWVGGGGAGRHSVGCGQAARLGGGGRRQRKAPLAKRRRRLTRRRARSERCGRLT